MANKPENLKPFVKGDPRINRKGRPKSFDKLRELAQAIANEQGLVKDGVAYTNVEIILKKMMAENPERFLEIAFGKVPQPVDVNANGKIELVVKYADDDDGTPAETP